MSSVNGLMKDGVLYVKVTGRVDSSNADTIEAEINALCSANTYDNIVLDADELQYISSAGLRVLLRIRKSNPDFKAINVSADVYEIFEMTGFTEIINVEKGYRKLSVDNCEVIGRGANGEVFRLDADTIIKVYFNSDCLPDIHRERELARKAFILGIPTAIPYDVVKVGDSFGSVFELLNAKPFSELIKDESEESQKYIEMYTELLKKIHSTSVKPGDMPDMRLVAINWVKFLEEFLPAETYNKLTSLMEAIPTDYHMMHGDYHVKNVMLQNGEALLIDMDTLCHGNPVFELASMYNAYVGFSIIDNTVAQKFLGIPYEVTRYIWKKSLRLYLDSSDEAYIGEVEKKAMLIGYCRLMRRSIRRAGLESEAGRKEIEYYKNQIINLVGEIDCLTF